MAEYIEKEALIAFLEDNHDDKDWLVNQYNADWICSWIESQPAADVVSRVAFDQVVWERDTAMKQLKEHGIPFGGEADVVAVVRCKDCKYYGDTAYGDMCKRWEDWLPVEDDDFCSYGEKSGGDDE